MYITTSYSLCSICARSTTSSHEYPFCALTYNHTCLGPLHTRDWEPVTVSLRALSLVENAEPVQVCFTLRLRDQRSKWMQDGCKVYMDSHMAWTGSCLTCTIFQNHLLEVGLTQNRETMALRMLTTVDWFCFYHVWGPTWIKKSLK